MMLFIAIIVLILLVWFRTEAWIEYCRLFRANFLSFYKDFDAKQYQDVSLTYHGYLRRYHNCFFTRLITCPVCLTIWLVLTGIFIKFAFFVLLGMALHTGIVGVLLVLLEIACEFPPVVVGSLIVFGVVDRLLG